MTAVIPSSLLPGLAIAAAGSVAFSGKAIIAKLAYRHGVDAVTLLMLRMVFALPLFVAMAWWSSRGKPRLTGREWMGVAGLGFSGYYLASFLDFAGLVYITASLERLVLYLTPTLVLLLGWALHKKPFHRMQVAGTAISYAGVAMVFGRELGAVGPDTILGFALVFASAVSYAVYLVFSGQLVQTLGAMRLVGLATSFACLCCIAQYMVLRPWDAAFALAPEVIWLSVLNATLCTAVPVLLVMMAIERIGAQLYAQVSMVGPLSTIVMGTLLLDEPFTGWIVAGTVLVLIGIWVFTQGPRVPAPAALVGQRRHL
ncbi:DMT family transporter [Ramlibacter sp. AN1015]|uniref:DMT family transporter n=1 Tax=Ramlibacter sp. AN1015 TaxID=3133428 RepID=UPI0030C63E54